MQWLAEKGTSGWYALRASSRTRTLLLLASLQVLSSASAATPYLLSG